MTQPSERRRALRWGRDTLAAIMADPGVPPGMWQEAEALMAAYPDDRSPGA
ncbi:BPSL0761 family protein [Roseateles sp.]|uniref:BPSL0761 family protein n=1 Tax=Roseateles sp. TaxID=1971397 RepID=UPI0039C9040C